ncbi:hypothetical protein NDU88_000590 [Pleurodeles waltl]|uniref:Uncharacterized protein n=1 Tax=Pleurodeles waltl TaxID=8319 RepID=A0AAV7P1R1_PLEWA|nr:hypothetical protein NDU88_000590 [Pleurodeles waltl]
MPHLQAGTVHRGQGPGAGASARSLTYSDGNDHDSGAVPVRDHAETTSPAPASIQAKQGSLSARRPNQVGRALQHSAQPLHKWLLIPWRS